MSSKPDFSEFEDWQLKNFVGQRRVYDFDDYSESARGIIKRNIDLLCDKQAWHNHVQKFELEIAKITDEDARQRARDQFSIMFASAIISNDLSKCDFRQFHFPCAVNFNYTSFSSAVDFTGATFMGIAGFGHARFPQGVDFSGTSFSMKSNFSKAAFLKEAIFEDTQFADKLMFIETSFQGNISLAKTSVQNAANFGKAHFANQANFAHAEFGGTLNFDRAKFDDHVMFDGMKCKQRATYLDVDFRGAAQFFNCDFAEHVGFIGAAFHNKSFFSDTTIKGDANFRSVRFDRYCQFEGASIGGTAVFAKTQFLDGAGFQKTTIRISTFMSTWFGSKIPDFRNARFERPPSVAGLVVFPPMYSPPFQLNGDLELVEKLRALKTMAHDINDHEKEGQFFAMEMAAKRGTEITKFGHLLLTWLYMTFSNFGQSYARPLWGLFGLWASFGAGYYLSLPKQFEGLSGALIAAQLSMQNSLPFISSFGRFAAQPNTEGYVGWFQKQINTINDIHGGFDHFLIPSIIQQAFGAILLFLLILGLRNVFRMK